jgi:CubicO group peptidase (beta-lactamase class C family)
VNTDEAIADEMDDDDLPGVSVAVIENGQFRYTRGFGHADIANDVTMDSEHVLRTASVSKAVGGALALRLSDASGSFDVKSTAGEHLDDLPSHHTATLEELASNRGCVRHYADADDVADPEEFEAQQDADTHLRSTEFNSAYGALLHFQDDPLVLGCSVGDDEVYSTHGYTMLGAALEATADVAIADLVTGLISQPFDLDTLRLEDMGDTSVRRAKLYKNGDNELATPDEISWKVLGGGLESTAKDLARFADRLQDGSIVENPEYIWNGADQGWGYAYGWDIRSDHNGHRRVGKSGGQLGSDAYLLMYPDDAVAIAVLINREELAEDDDNARRIAEAVGELMF